MRVRVRLWMRERECVCVWEVLSSWQFPPPLIRYVVDPSHFPSFVVVDDSAASVKMVNDEKRRFGQHLSFLSFFLSVFLSFFLNFFTSFFLSFYDSSSLLWSSANKNKKTDDKDWEITIQLLIEKEKDRKKSQRK